MKFGGCAAIAAMALLVSGCGGGGDSGSGGTILPISGATPTPTTTPTPSPTYTLYRNPRADLTGAGSFVLTEIQGSTASSAPTSMAASFQVGVVEAVFSGKDRTAHLADFVRGKFANFSAVDLVYEQENGVGFEKVNPDYSTAQLVIFFPKIEDYQFSYLTFIKASHRIRGGSPDPNQYTDLRYDFLIGSQTVTSDIPKEDAFYRAAWIPTFADTAGGLVPSIEFGYFNLSKIGGLTGRFSYQGTSSTGVSKAMIVSIAGSRDQQTNMISGTMSSSDGSLSGTFQGYLYGPNGKEMGFLFSIKSPDGRFATSGIMMANMAGTGYWPF